MSVGGAESLAGLVKDAVVFLGAAAVLVPLAQRIRVNPTLAYILIGVAMGPSGFGALHATAPWLEWLVISDPGALALFAELGVVFLLFMIGLELSFGELWALRRYVLGLGAAQVFVTAAVIGGIASQFGNSAPASVLLGLCFSLSSTAIVVQLLAQRHALATPVGRITFSVLLFQDLMVVPLLILPDALAGSGETLLVALSLTLLKAVVAIVVILGVGRLIVRPFFRFAALASAREVFMAAILLLVIGTAVLTDAAGLSMALGAFLCGLLLSESEFRNQVEVDIEPFKGLLLGVFFFSVGLSIDLGAVADQIGLVLLAVAGLVAIKAGLLVGLGRLFGLSWPMSLEMAILLAQGGEFAFIVVGLGGQAGVLPPETVQFMLAVTGLSMLTAPLAAIAAPVLRRRLARVLPEGPPLSDLPDAAPGEGHVVLAGLGRVGLVLARVLEAAHIPYVAIEGNAKTVSDQRLAGRHVRFGDIGQVETLRRAGLARARAVVLTVDDPGLALRTVRLIRATWPHVPVIARARDPQHALGLIEEGAGEAVPETLEASLQLAARVLENLGLETAAVQDRIAAERSQQIDHVRAGLSG